MMNFFSSAIAPVLFPSVLWRTKDQSVHITFDDGPHQKATPKVLDALAKRGICATFFLVGERLQRHPDIGREIICRGHIIGNHSHTHQSLLFKPPSVQREEIQLADRAMRDLLNTQPEFFRPPFGYFDLRTLRVVKSEGLHVVMWNLDAHDFSGARTRDIPAIVSGSARPGSIILLHDNDATQETLDSYLPPLLDRLIDRGHVFSPLTI